MMTKEQAADIFDRVRRFSAADEVEVLFTGARFALTRFANNAIHQNVEDENCIASIRTIFDRVRRFSAADEVEVLFTGARFALTRFANNAIHQNVEDENCIASIRTNFGGQTARATAHQFEQERLERAVDASEKLARVQEPDPD